MSIGETSVGSLEECMKVQPERYAKSIRIFVQSDTGR
jgi:hypothetical protein